MKTALRRTALTSIAIVFLLSGTTAVFADDGSHSGQAQTLNAVMVGGVTNLGTQQYSVSGGQVAFAMIAGQRIDPTSATIQYKLEATQSGLSTRGEASIQFSGMTVPGGVSVSVNGKFNINDNIPVAVFGKSELPFYFLASSPNVKITVGGSTQTVGEVLAIESPYFNPWGAPIVLASGDNSIVIAATYTKGSIQWIGSQVGGVVTGTLGTTHASGSFSMTTNEQENLVTGIAQDSGTIAFSSMTLSSLNAKGQYSGTSTIPTARALDCSPVDLPGTCTETGFQSTGKFTMGGITGSYSTAWGVPAMGFTSTVSATVSQTGNSGHQGN